MPPMSFFVEKNYTVEYRSHCVEWLNPEGNLEICNDGEDCTEPWCYVIADVYCDPSIIYIIRSFADTEYAGSLKFSMIITTMNDNDNDNNNITDYTDNHANDDEISIEIE